MDEGSASHLTILRMKHKSGSQPFTGTLHGTRGRDIIAWEPGELSGGLGSPHGVLIYGSPLYEASFRIPQHVLNYAISGSWK